MTTHPLLQRLLAGGLLCFALLAAGCAASASAGDETAQSAESAPPEAGVVFSRDVQPVLAEKFAPLLTEDPGLRVDTWQHLVEGSERGEVLIAYDPGNSLIVEVAEQALREGQEGAPTRAEIDRVRAWIADGAQNDAGEVPYAGETDLLYVTSQGEALVTVIDMSANLVVRTVDLKEMGFDANAKPHHVAVEPDGSYWYVSLIGANKVLKFDRSNELVGQFDFEVPGMLALDPGTSRLFVGRSMSAVNPPTRVGVVDREAMTVEEVDVFFPRPHAIAAQPDGRLVYSASLAQNEVATVDPEAEVVELTSLEGPVHTLVQFAVSPDGSQMVAGGQLSGQVFFFDAQGATPTVTDTLTLGGQPWHPVYTPDGAAVYMPRKTANAVTVLDARSRRVMATIEDEGLAEPHGSTVRPDGRYVYVSGNNRTGDYRPRYALGDNAKAGTVTVIETATNEVVKVIEVEDYPTGIGAPAATR